MKPKALPRCFPLKISETILNELAIRIDPPMPCTVRAASKNAKLCAEYAAKAPAPNRKNPAVYSFLRLVKSPKRPKNINSDVKTI